MINANFFLYNFDYIFLDKFIGKTNLSFTCLVCISCSVDELKKTARFTKSPLLQLDVLVVHFQFLILFWKHEWKESVGFIWQSDWYCTRCGRENWKRSKKKIFHHQSHGFGLISNCKLNVFFAVCIYFCTIEDIRFLYETICVHNICTW